MHAQISCIGNFACEAVAEQHLRPFRKALASRPAHGEDVAPLGERIASGDERTGRRTRADDHRRVRKAGDDPVALREVGAERFRSRYELVQHGAAARGDPVEELAVLDRVGLVDSAAEDGDRRATAPERSRMGGGIDPSRTARDHFDPCAGEILSERPGHPESPVVAFPRPDDGDIAGGPLSLQESGREKIRRGFFRLVRGMIGFMDDSQKIVVILKGPRGPAE